MIMWFARGFKSDISFLGTVLNLFDNFLSSMFPILSSPFTLSTVPNQCIWSFCWRSSSFLNFFIFIVVLLFHPSIFLLAPYLFFYTFGRCL